MQDDTTAIGQSARLSLSVTGRPAGASKAPPRARRLRGGRQRPQIGLVRLLPGPVDLPGVERQARRHPAAGNQFPQAFTQRIQLRVSVDLGLLKLVGGETRRPVHHVMSVVEFPVERRNPPLGAEPVVELRSRQGG